jgi:hypothetical protein
MCGMTAELVRRVESANVGDRRLAFAVIPVQSRARVTIEGGGPADGVIGSVIHLDTEQPALRVAAPHQAEWAVVHCAAIIEAAVTIWSGTVKDCRG